ncbi:MFS transporter [Candidatus Bathyarchaeota archaeon]|nr:MFS transporter [Candidatus Bathyarchaeota archaeon]
MSGGFLAELREVWNRQKKNWRTVVTRQIFNRFFNELTLNYLEIYITLLGAGKVQLGAVKSASGLAQAIISPPLGIIRDRYNIRKIYLIGVGLFTFIPLIFALSPNWYWIAPAIFLSGLAMMIGSCVIICDLSLPSHDRATGKALCEGIGALPTILAPTVAAGLLTLFGGIGIGSIRKLYWIQFFARVVLFFYVYKNLTDIERINTKTDRVNIIRDFQEVFERGTSTVRWLFFQGFNMFTLTMLTTFRYPYVYEVKQGSQFIIGGIGTTMLITETIFSTIIGRIADNIGRKRAFYILMPLMAAANIALILAPSPRWLLVSGFLMGFRMIASFSYGSMTPELVPRDCLGRWRGIVGFVTGLAAIPAPIIGGYIWERFGPEWVFISITLIDLLVRLPLLYSVPETLNRKLKDG